MHIFNDKSDGGITPLTVSSSLQETVFQLYKMSRLRFGLMRCVGNKNPISSDLFLIRGEVIDELDEDGKPITLYTSFSLDSFDTDNTFVDAEIQLAVVAPMFLASGECDYIVHVAEAKHGTKGVDGEIELSPPTCTGLFIDKKGAKLLLVAAIEDCKTLAKETFKVDQWLETNPIKNPESTPEVREGHDPHHISPPNKNNSLWGFVSTDDVYSPHIETVNKGIRTAKREAEKIKSAIKEQEKDRGGQVIWN